MFKKIIIGILTIIFLAFLLSNLILYKLEYTTYVKYTGELRELKINSVIDKNSKYIKGQKYKVSHLLFMGDLVDRDIERVEYENNK